MGRHPVFFDDALRTHFGVDERHRRSGMDAWASRSRYGAGAAGCSSWGLISNERRQLYETEMVSTRSATAAPLGAENAALRAALLQVQRAERTLLSKHIESMKEQMEFVAESTSLLKFYKDKVVELGLQNEKLRDCLVDVKSELESLACFRPLKRGRRV